MGPEWVRKVQNFDCKYPGRSLIFRFRPLISLQRIWLLPSIACYTSQCQQEQESPSPLPVPREYMQQVPRIFVGITMPPIFVELVSKQCQTVGHQHNATHPS